MIDAFIKASGKEIKYEIVARREGDIGMCYANPKKANDELGWFAKYDLQNMCEDTWN